jgi:hypothetical protein
MLDTQMKTAKLGQPNRIQEEPERLLQRSEGVVVGNLRKQEIVGISQFHSHTPSTDANSRLVIRLMDRFFKTCLRRRLGFLPPHHEIGDGMLLVKKGNQLIILMRCPQHLL